MPFEYAHNFTTGNILYFVSFNANGEAFLSDGNSVEEWGAGGRNADDYDAPMTEIGSSGHYVGNSNVTSGNMVVQRITIFLQSGASPADSDVPLAQGERPVTPFMIWSVVTTGRPV